MQREMAVLENRTDPHGEGLAAGVALPQAGTAALAGQATNTFLIDVAAMEANGPSRPKMRLDVNEGGFFVVEVRKAQNRIDYGKSPIWPQVYA